MAHFSPQSGFDPRGTGDPWPSCAPSFLWFHPVVGCTSAHPATLLVAAASSWLCMELWDSFDACGVSSCGIWAGRRPPLGSSRAQRSVISEDWRCIATATTRLVFRYRILCCNDANNIFFCFHGRYWTAPSYFPSSVLVKSLYSDIILVVIKCTVL